MLSYPLPSFGSTAVSDGNHSLGSPLLNSRGCSQSLHAIGLGQEDNSSRSCWARVTFVSELLVLSIQHSFLHSANIFCGSTVCQALCWALELIGHTVITPISQKGKLRLRGVPSPVQEGGRQGLSGPCSVTRMPPLRACSFPSLLSTWGLCTPRGCSGLSLSLGTCLPPQPVDLTRLGLRAG